MFIDLKTNAALKVLLGSVCGLSVTSPKPYPPFNQIGVETLCGRMQKFQCEVLNFFEFFKLRNITFNHRAIRQCDKYIAYGFAIQPARTFASINDAHAFS